MMYGMTLIGIVLGVGYSFLARNGVYVSFIFFAGWYGFW